MANEEQSFLQRLFGAYWVRTNPPEPITKPIGSKPGFQAIQEENDTDHESLFPQTSSDSKENPPQSSKGSLSRTGSIRASGLSVTRVDSGGVSSTLSSDLEESAHSLAAGVPLRRSHEQSNLRRYIGMQWFDYLVSMFPYSFMSRSRKSVAAIDSDPSAKVTEEEAKRHKSAIIGQSGSTSGTSKRKGQRKRNQSRASRANRRTATARMRRMADTRDSSNSDVSEAESDNERMDNQPVNSRYNLRPRNNRE